jgi:hypothetical protein
LSQHEETERRNGKRSKTDDEVLFTINEVVMPGKLLNLSRDGCMIEGDCVTATAGRKISVTLLEGFTVIGEIMWKNGDRMGVGFYQELVDATLKYFQLRSIEHEEHQSPADRFGRELPPMRRQPDLK